ncbi:hypothetical protein TWF281_005498 [Arthrobotrys megalospora]
MRAFAIAPATSTFSTESESLVIMGVLELNMGIISTSLPTWYMWMDISRQDKRRFREYQPFRFIRRVTLPLTFILQRWTRESYKRLVTRIEEKMTISRIIRQFQRIQNLPYYKMLYWSPEANPAQKVIGRQTRLYNIAFRLRRWFRITLADISHRFKTFFGLNEDPLPIKERKLALRKKRSKSSKRFKKKKPRYSDISDDEDLYELTAAEPLLKQQRECFLTNRNYNILFTSGETATDRIRDEELELMNDNQRDLLNSEDMDWKMKQNLVGSQDRNLDRLIFHENTTGRRNHRNMGKDLGGVRRRKGF